MQWQLSVETSAADDGTAEVVMGCSVRAAHENGAWSRWITADFFVCDDHSYGYKAGDVREKMVGSAPLPCSAGEPRLTSDQVTERERERERLPKAGPAIAYFCRFRSIFG